jgi:hypothetical protein
MLPGAAPSGKRAAECLTMDYHREHNLEVQPTAMNSSLQLLPCL